MFDGGRSRHVDGVIGRLRDAGFAVEIERVSYEFQRGGNEMLRVARRSEEAPGLNSNQGLSTGSPRTTTR